jgi:hypothetical protein
MKKCSQCGHLHDPAFATCGECGARLPDQSVEEVVAAWLESEDSMFDTVSDSPEVAWVAVLQILGRDLTDDQTALLAAGPLEELIVMHGPQFIERIETEARHNPKFNYLLGGVWKSSSLPEIWSRIEKARKEVW